MNNHCLPEITRKTKTMGRVVNCGYVYIYKPSHPRAASHSGYVAEHVLVAESVAGRMLLDGEHVHHIDGNRLNNHPANLQIVSASQHATIHRREPRLIDMACAYCGAVFKKRHNQAVTKIKNGQTDFYCTRRCSGRAFGRGRAKTN